VGYFIQHADQTRTLVRQSGERNMASKITIKTKDKDNYFSILKLLSFYNIMFKVSIEDITFDDLFYLEILDNKRSHLTVFTVPYYLNKNKYRLVEMALQIDHNYHQHVNDDGTLTFTLKKRY